MRSLLRVNVGTLGFSVVSQKGDTLLDLEAENEDIRNDWVRVALLLLARLVCGFHNVQLGEFLSAFLTLLSELCNKLGDESAAAL